MRSRSKRPPASLRTKDFSTSACIRSPAQGDPSTASTSSTASAASSVKPPSKADNCASADCSAGDSKSQDQSSVARIVDWRSWRRPSVASSLKRSPMRRSNKRGGITRARDTASSMANGRQSSSFISSGSAASSSGLVGSGTPAARARSRNSCVASSMPIGASTRACSPAMPSNSRLVVMKLAAGAFSSQTPTVASACRATCSKLSRISRQAPRSAMAVANWSTGSVLPIASPRVCATACAMPSTLRAALRSQNQTPPG